MQEETDTDVDFDTDTDIETDIDGENPNMTPERMLDELCWQIGWDGMESFPPEEVIEEQKEFWREEAAEYENIEIDEKREGMIESQIWERFYNAQELVSNLVLEGFDPIARAERHVERITSETSDEDGVFDIDWTWWHESKPGYIEELSP